MDVGLARLAAKAPCTIRRWFATLPPAVPNKVDLVTWDSWVHGPSFVGSTVNDPVYDPDTLYVSYGPGWVNIDWPTLVVGQRIQIKSPDGTTLFQDWVATAAFIVSGVGGHVAVAGAGGPLIGLSEGTPIQCVWVS